MCVMLSVIVVVAGCRCAAGALLIIYNDPEPDVPKDVTPMAQCAFESLMFNVSAVYTN